MDRMLTRATVPEARVLSHRAGWLRAGIVTGISALAGVLTAVGMPRDR